LQLKPLAQLSSKPIHKLINIIVTLTPISVCNFGQTFRAFERQSWIMPDLNAYNIYLWLKRKRLKIKYNCSDYLA
jgi:hypothetical protein